MKRKSSGDNSCQASSAQHLPAHVDLTLTVYVKELGPPSFFISVSPDFSLFLLQPTCRSPSSHPTSIPWGLCLLVQTQGPLSSFPLSLPSKQCLHSLQPPVGGEQEFIGLRVDMGETKRWMFFFKPCLLHLPCPIPFPGTFSGTCSR